MISQTLQPCVTEFFSHQSYWKIFFNKVKCFVCISLLWFLSLLSNQRSTLGCQFAWLQLFYFKKSKRTILFLAPVSYKVLLSPISESSLRDFCRLWAFKWGRACPSSVTVFSCAAEAKVQLCLQLCPPFNSIIRLTGHHCVWTILLAVALSVPHVATAGLSLV